MNDCCENKTKEKKASPRKFTCPTNELQYVEVSIKTILQHIKSPWENALQDQQYYFCDDPDCEVVYFGLKGSVINKGKLRTRVGKKEHSDEALICYCFGVSKKKAMQDPEIKKYVTQQTKAKNCACELRNPSGRCCLKDFPNNNTALN